jgi:hypothetical protein
MKFDINNPQTLLEINKNSKLKNRLFYAYSSFFVFIYSLTMFFYITSSLVDVELAFRLFSSNPIGVALLSFVFISTASLFFTVSYLCSFPFGFFKYKIINKEQCELILKQADKNNDIKNYIKMVNKQNRELYAYELNAFKNLQNKIDEKLKKENDTISYNLLHSI